MPRVRNDVRPICLIEVLIGVDKGGGKKSFQELAPEQEDSF